MIFLYEFDNFGDVFLCQISPFPEMGYQAPKDTGGVSFADKIVTLPAIIFGMSNCRYGNLKFSRELPLRGLLLRGFLLGGLREQGELFV
jgi:hypothetical protein